MGIFKKDLKKIRDDAIAMYDNIIPVTPRSMVHYVGFLSLWLTAFFFDTPIRSFVKLVHSNWYGQLFSLFHWYGKPFLSIATILVCYFGGIIFTKAQMKTIGLKLFESFAFSGIIVTILKSVFGRWRPYAEHGSFSFEYFTFGPNDHLSLPSGDVAIAFAFSSIIAVAIDNKIWKWMWFLFAIITAIGRMYHDQHWLSDVILASAIAIWIGNCINGKRLNNNTSKH